MTRPRNYLDYLNPTTGKMWRAAQGNDYDLVKWTGFSRNPQINTTTTPEWVWHTGTPIVLPAAAAAASIVSASTADAAAGTGARTVLVTGLDANYLDVTETVTLNGTTPVNLSAQLLRCNRIEVITAGSGRTNAGDITLSIGGAAQCASAAGTGISNTAVFTVGANYATAYLIDLFVNVSQGGSGSCTIELMKRTPGGINQQIVSYAIDTQGTSFVDRQLIEDPIVLEPRTDVWFNVPSVTANNTVVGTIWKFLLVRASAS